MCALSSNHTGNHSHHPPAPPRSTQRDTERHREYTERHREYTLPTPLKADDDELARRPFGTEEIDRDRESDSDRDGESDREEIGTNAFMLRWRSKVLAPSSSVFAFTGKCAGMCSAKQSCGVS